MERCEDRKILRNCATHGVTGTYDRAAQSITEYGTLGVSGGRGEKRVADEESTRARLQYLSAPESGGRQPRIHHDVNDPLLLGPQPWRNVGEQLKRTVQERTVANRSDLTQAP